jgi:hypothetical protein
MIWSWLQVMYMVSTWVNVLIYVLCTPFFIYYQKELPIRYRCPGIKITAASIMIISILLRFIYEFIWPFVGLKAIERVLWLLCVASLLPVFIRHYYLVGKAQELQVGVKSRRYLATNHGAWVAYVINGIIPVVVLVIVSLRGNESIDIITGKVNNVGSILMLIQCVFATAFLCWYIFSAPKDSLGLKTQFLALVVVAIGYSCVAMMAQLFGIGEIQKTLLAVTVPTVVLCLDYAWPVFVSMKLRKRNKRKAIKDTSGVDSLCRKALQRSTCSSTEQIELGSALEDELERILSSPKQSESFSRFLAKEYCLEYLMFLQDVEAYRYCFYDFEVRKVREVKDQIVEDYLIPNSVNELEELPQKIQELYWIDTQIKPDLFLEAEVWVKQYLVDHHLARFENWFDEVE